MNSRTNTKPRVVSERVIQLIWFVTAIYATGAIWYFLSRNEYIPAIISFASAASLGWAAFYLQGVNDRDKRLRSVREQLGGFLREAEHLLSQANDDPPPIAEHNDWVSRTEAYLSECLDSSYVVRFSNFAGLTFYLDNPNREFKKSLQGRSRRLHEFLEEFTASAA